MKRAFILSDLHLGGETGFQMCPERNQRALASLLATFVQQHTEGIDINVVLAGDIVDFLSETPFQSFTAVDEHARAKLERILGRTEVVWNALADVVRHGCELTLLIGNHDIELALPKTRQQLLSRLGPGRVTLRVDGTPVRLGTTVVLHGNADDAWNHVPHGRLSDFAAGAAVDSAEIVVTGSELVTEVMNDLKQDHPWVDLLKPETSAVFPLLAVLYPSTVKLIPRLARLYARRQRRALDWATDNDDIAAAIPATITAHLELARELAGDTDDVAAAALFEPIKKMWRSTNDAFRTSVRKRLRLALRALAPIDYFQTNCEDPVWQRSAEKALRDHGAQNVIFGHTHIAKHMQVNGGHYLNTGTWADLLSLPPETWIEEPARSDEEAFEAFIDDLVDNQLGTRRKLVGSYACVDYGDSGSHAQLRLRDGRPVEQGNLMDISNE